MKLLPVIITRPGGVVYYLVQPFGVDQPGQAIVLSAHATAEDAYDRLDAIAEAPQMNYSFACFEIYITDEHQQPVARPRVQRAADQHVRPDPRP